MINQQQVRDLLGQGLSNEIVATTVGCDPSYISQLMSDETFSQEVIALRAANLTAANSRDKSIDSIEDSLILKLKDAVDQNLIYKPNDIMRAFFTVNNAKRRGVPAHEAVVIQNRVVNLTIPQVVVNKFVTNIHNEVVEVGNDTLVTMDSRQLLDNMSNREGGKHAEQLKKIAGYLQSSS